MEKERAVEIVSHNVAACIHGALVHRKMTVAELKAKITDWDAELVDSILLGVQPDKIKCNHLADIALIVGFDWSITVTCTNEPDTVYTPAGPEQKINPL